MILQPIYCSYCNRTNLIKNSKTPEGKQRFRCRESPCDGRIFILDYSHQAYNRKAKQQIVDMVLNGSGVRDPAGGLYVSPI